MTLAERRSGNVAIIDVVGRITDDENGDILLRDALKNLVMQGQTALLLNLERVPSIDSAGLGAVAHGYISAKRRGGTLKLLRVSGRVRELLTITRLASVFETFDTEADAVASFETAST